MRRAPSSATRLVEGMRADTAAILAQDQTTRDTADEAETDGAGPSTPHRLTSSALLAGRLRPDQPT